MSIKQALKRFSERKIGIIAGESHYITLPKWGKKGETVIVEVQDENTLIVSRNKSLTLE